MIWKGGYGMGVHTGGGGGANYRGRGRVSAILMKMTRLLKLQSFCVMYHMRRRSHGARETERGGQIHTAFRPPFLEMQEDNGINFNHCTLGY